MIIFKAQNKNNSQTRILYPKRGYDSSIMKVKIKRFIYEKN